MYTVCLACLPDSLLSDSLSLSSLVKFMVSVYILYCVKYSRWLIVGISVCLCVCRYSSLLSHDHSYWSNWLLLVSSLSALFYYPHFIYYYYSIPFFLLSSSSFSTSVSKTLGEGQFGYVSKGMWAHANERHEVAVKMLKPDATDQDRLKLLQEAAIMGQFSHKNIVKLHGVVTVGEPVSSILVISQTHSNGKQKYNRHTDCCWGNFICVVTFLKL